METKSGDDISQTLLSALQTCAQNKSCDSLDENIFESCESSPSYFGGLNGDHKNINKLPSEMRQDKSSLFDFMMTSEDLLFCNRSPPFYPPSPSSSATYDCGTILDDEGRISLAYENLKYIPKRIAEKFSSDTMFLDLSYNNFRSLSFLTYFKVLHTLILDRNTSLDESTLPFLPKLKILWLNNCEIQNIPKWIFRIQSQCPNLEQLSLMGNPGARTSVNGGSEYENKDFHLFIKRTLTNLIYLDGIPIDHQIETSSDKVSIKNSSIENAKKFELKKNSLTLKNSRGNLRSLFRVKKLSLRNSYSTSSTS